MTGVDDMLVSRCDEPSKALVGLVISLEIFGIAELEPASAELDMSSNVVLDDFSSEDVLDDVGDWSAELKVLVKLLIKIADEESCDFVDCDKLNVDCSLDELNAQMLDD
jgi:hypothetical protein